jgi:hypothetical protein
MTAPRTHVLVVAGMHRSGTSLAANWLAHCGLDMGDTLIPADFSNPTGHYEDRLFVDLQREMLSANETDHWVTGARALTVSPALRQRAADSITGRDSGQWGWKDPRTTLFLDFWHDLLPDMKVLVVYRHYAQVVDSLLRRELNLRRNRPGWPQKPLKRRVQVTARQSFLNVPLVREYLRVWNRYNRDALAFAAGHPADCLVLHVSDLVPQADRLIDYVNRTWGFALNPVDSLTVYDPALLKTRRMPVRMAESALLVPACVRTYRDLAHWRRISLERITPP